MDRDGMGPHAGAGQGRISTPHIRAKRYCADHVGDSPTGLKAGPVCAPCEQRRELALQLRSKLLRELHRGFDFDTSD